MGRIVSKTLLAALLSSSPAVAENLLANSKHQDESDSDKISKADVGVFMSRPTNLASLAEGKFIGSKSSHVVKTTGFVQSNGVHLIISGFVNKVESPCSDLLLVRFRNLKHD